MCTVYIGSIDLCMHVSGYVWIHFYICYKFWVKAFILNNWFQLVTTRLSNALTFHKIKFDSLIVFYHMPRNCHAKSLDYYMYGCPQGWYHWSWSQKLQFCQSRKLVSEDITFLKSDLARQFCNTRVFYHFSMILYTTFAIYRNGVSLSVAKRLKENGIIPYFVIFRRVNKQNDCRYQWKIFFVFKLLMLFIFFTYSMFYVRKKVVGMKKIYYMIVWRKTGAYPMNYAFNLSFDKPCPVYGANMGPTWVLSAPDGPHVGPMNLAIRVFSRQFYPYPWGFPNWHWGNLYHKCQWSNSERYW